VGHRLAHFEIAGKQGERLESFYAKLFGWKIERKVAGGYPYGAIDTGSNPGLTGGIRHEPEGKAEVVFYVEVPDVAAATRLAQALGATVRIPPMTFEDKTFSLIADPEGNPVGIIQKLK